MYCVWLGFARSICGNLLLNADTGHPLLYLYIGNGTRVDFAWIQTQTADPVCTEGIPNKREFQGRRT